MSGPVTIPYSLLLQPDERLPPLIRQAFSSEPGALGLLIVSELPDALDFSRLRNEVLLFSNKFASLPEKTREKYTDPSTKWSYGWSHGKEIMNGKPDKLKGSYYNNPTTDLTPSSVKGQPSHPNIWPNEPEVEGYEQACKALYKVMVATGLLVARACEGLTQGGELATTKGVEELLATSESSKARLLHYFARECTSFSIAPPAEAEKEDPIDDAWCGTHVDHSLLTGLCPGMFLFHPIVPDGAAPLEPVPIPTPSLSAGLFIKTRAGETIRAPIPEDCLAFQTGETLELLSAGRLAATPHFVNSTASTLSPACRAVLAEHKANTSAWKDVEAGTITRETLACFLQPNVDEVVSSSGETFGEFSRRVRERHY